MVSGIIIVDKPSGMTSFGVVKRVQRIIKAKKAGHTGTLDPFATGVLPICINEATKIVPFLIGDDKEYMGTMRLGIETDSGDITGKILKEVEVPKSIPKEMIKEILGRFHGEITQIPPVLSAKKKGGVSLHRLVRQGKEVSPDPITIRIYDIELTGLNLPELSFRVRCSKGTYIRSLARDIGRELGFGAHLRALRRTRAGSFSIEEALTMEELKEGLYEKGGNHIIKPIEKLLFSWVRVMVTETSEKKVRQGRRLIGRDLGEDEIPFFHKGEKVRVFSSEGRLVAIAEALETVREPSSSFSEKQILQPIRVFN